MKRLALLIAVICFGSNVVTADTGNYFNTPSSGNSFRFVETGNRTFVSSPTQQVNNIPFYQPGPTIHVVTTYLTPSISSVPANTGSISRASNSAVNNLTSQYSQAQAINTSATSQYSALNTTTIDYSGLRPVIHPKVNVVKVDGKILIQSNVNEVKFF